MLDPEIVEITLRHPGSGKSEPVVARFCPDSDETIICRDILRLLCLPESRTVDLEWKLKEQRRGCKKAKADTRWRDAEFKVGDIAEDGVEIILRRRQMVEAGVGAQKA